MTMLIRPIGNRVVVTLTKKPTTTTSGIILATKEKEEQAIGEIIAIGTGLGSEENVSELGLKVGEKIMFGKYAGEELVDDNNPDIIYKIVPSKDIVAVLS